MVCMEKGSRCAALPDTWYHSPDPLQVMLLGIGLRSVALVVKDGSGRVLVDSVQLFEDAAKQLRHLPATTLR